MQLLRNVTWSVDLLVENRHFHLSANQYASLYLNRTIIRVIVLCVCVCFSAWIIFLGEDTERRSRGVSAEPADIWVRDVIVESIWVNNKCTALFDYVWKHDLQQDHEPLLPSSPQFLSMNPGLCQIQLKFLQVFPLRLHSLKWTRLWPHKIPSADHLIQN